MLVCRFASAVSRMTRAWANSSWASSIPAPRRAGSCRRSRPEGRHSVRVPIKVVARRGSEGRAIDAIGLHAHARSRRAGCAVRCGHTAGDAPPRGGSISERITECSGEARRPSTEFSATLFGAGIEQSRAGPCVRSRSTIGRAVRIVGLGEFDDQPRARDSLNEQRLQRLQLHTIDRL